MAVWWISTIILLFYSISMVCVSFECISLIYSCVVLLLSHKPHSYQCSSFVLLCVLCISIWSIKLLVSCSLISVLSSSWTVTEIELNRQLLLYFSSCFKENIYQDAFGLTHSKFQRSNYERINPILWLARRFVSEYSVSLRQKLVWLFRQQINFIINLFLFNSSWVVLFSHPADFTPG